MRLLLTLILIAAAFAAGVHYARQANLPDVLSWIPWESIKPGEQAPPAAPAPAPKADTNRPSAPAADRQPTLAVQYDPAFPHN